MTGLDIPKNRGALPERGQEILQNRRRGPPDLPLTVGVGNGVPFHGG